MAAMPLTLPPTAGRAPAWTRSKPRRPCPASCTPSPVTVAGRNPRSRQPPTIQARGASLPARGRGGVRVLGSRYCRPTCEVSRDGKRGLQAGSASRAWIEDAAQPILVRPGLGRGRGRGGGGLGLGGRRAFAAQPHVVAVFASCDLRGSGGHLSPGLPNIAGLRGPVWRGRGLGAVLWFCLQCLQLLGRLAVAPAGGGGQSIGAVAVERELLLGLGLAAAACNVLAAIKKGRAQLAVGPAREVVQIVGRAAGVLVHEQAP